MSKAWFHFELFWPKFGDYIDVVLEAWKRPANVHDPMVCLDLMLRSLVCHLQRWSSARIGEIKAQLLMARELVMRLDSAQEQRQLSEAKNELRKRLKIRCLGLSSLERTMARQHSRVKQLSEGDANTAYFHLIARGRKWWNFIPALSVDGHVVTDHCGMELALHSHSAEVFGSVARGGHSLNFEALGFHQLSLEDQDEPISADEVWATIKAMPSNRALGPDGFTEAFYKTAWPVIQLEVMEAVHAFEQGNNSMDQLNNALIALLPKKVGTSCPSDFTPITMIHSFAKLISKILSL
jgi:hypothetical protein